MSSSIPIPLGKAPVRSLCRYLTVKGLPCRQTAMHGENFCVAHARNRFPVCPRPADGVPVAIPLLEDLGTIQVVATQIAQGLLAETIDPWRAGKVLYACQIAALTLARPARLLAGKQEPPAEPVTETFLGPDGELLGPVQTGPGVGVKYESVWSFDKYRYEQECERLGRPAPKSPADMPDSGWLTPDDIASISSQANQGKVILDDGYPARTLDLRLDADRRGLLPPLIERKCPYGELPNCSGPGEFAAGYRTCDWCLREREEYMRLHPDFDPWARFKAPPARLDLKACAPESCADENRSESPAQPLLSRLSTPLSPVPSNGGQLSTVMGGAPRHNNLVNCIVIGSIPGRRPFRRLPERRPGVSSIDSRG